MGLYPVVLPPAAAIEGPFVPAGAHDGIADGAGAPSTLRYFSAHDVAITGEPDWFRNPWREESETAAERDSRHWSRIGDFDAEVGDIKTVWEASRFDWAPKLAWSARSGSNGLADRALLERWIASWCRANPPNIGINWKCGQESALRTLNFWVALAILDGPEAAPPDGALHFFETHLRRILPTTHYARGQDNNHATSEAAALFCVGACLERHAGGEMLRLGQRANATGRRLLETSVRRLVAPDGSFSQSSMTYHRLMLDTLVLCALAQRAYRLAPFSESYQGRARAATRWLEAFVDPRSGDAPNLGANDGAYLLNVEEADYRDFRPTLARALGTFHDEALDQNSSPLLEVFGVAPGRIARPGHDNRVFGDGGYARLNAFGGRGFLLFRFPKYRFRASHCDGNHLDLWLDGMNCTLDGGSFSYNSDGRDDARFFSSTVAHCTVMFDERDQMPRVGRFLRGEWLQPERMELDADAGTIDSAYIDYRGACHGRHVSASSTYVDVVDRGTGFATCAVVRWRLPPLDWTLEGERLVSEHFALSFSSGTPHEIALGESVTSLRYLEKSAVSVVEITFHRPFELHTRFTASEA